MGLILFLSFFFLYFIDGYDSNAYNNVRDILYNNDVINIVKSIVHSPVGKLL